MWFMDTSTLKDLAHDFLTMLVSGKIQEAYDIFVAPDFIHHNQYYEWDRESLKKGMEENHAEFPNKEITIIRMVAEDGIVAAYSKVILNPGDIQLKVVHIMRFEWDKIVEMWDIGEKLEANSPNENGVD